MFRFISIAVFSVTSVVAQQPIPQSFCQCVQNSAVGATCSLQAGTYVVGSESSCTAGGFPWVHIKSSGITINGNGSELKRQTGYSGTQSGDAYGPDSFDPLEQFALELLIGAHENSEWRDGKLVIAGNRGNIHLLQAAFYAVKLEVQRRGVVVCC